MLLRLPSGQGWRLRAKGATVALEESVYLGGEQRRNSQIVLTADPGADIVQWALERLAAERAGRGLSGPARR